MAELDSIKPNRVLSRALNIPLSSKTSSKKSSGLFTPEDLTAAKEAVAPLVQKQEEYRIKREPLVKDQLTAQAEEDKARSDLELAKMAAVTKAETESADRLGTAQKKYETELEKNPFPTFQPTQEDAMSYGQLGSMIATLGVMLGAGGKASAKVALGSMSGMMSGWQKGRKDLWDRESKTFEKEVQKLKLIHDDLQKTLKTAMDLEPTNKAAARAKYEEFAYKTGQGSVLESTNRNRNTKSTIATLDSAQKVIDQLDQLTMQMAQKQRTHIEDLEARQRQSEMTIEAARIRAEAGQGRRDEKALQAIGPALRTIAEQYPDGTANSLLGASPDDKRKIAGSFRAIDESEIAADFVARNPRAVGALAVIKNYLKIDSIKGIKNDDESAAASQKAAFIDSEIDKQVSKKLISKDDAEAAKLLQKKLFALALSDVQGSGQRGSVYLDRQFQNLYDQASRPQTLLKIIQERAAENNRNLRLYKLNVERNNNPENFPLYESDTQDKFNKYLKDRQPVASLNDVADTAKSNKITTEVAKKRLKDMGYRIEGEQ